MDGDPGQRIIQLIILIIIHDKYNLCNALIFFFDGSTCFTRNRSAL